MPASQAIRFGIFELDPSTGELWKHGRRVRLQEKPFQLLMALLERAGQVVTRQELRKALWANGTFVDFDHSINVAVNKLREVLEDSAETPRFVETLPRRGYRFISPVRRASDNGDTGHIDSIAVLPLENISGEPEQDYLADGFTEELILELGKIGALRVVSRQSVMRFKGTRAPVPEIARALAVDALVEGTVRRVGDRVRVTAQLITVEPEDHLWAESFEEDMSHVLQLQRRMARTLAHQIRVTLTPEERTRFGPAALVVPKAYDSYLRGRLYWNRFTRESLEKAIDLFGESIAWDPSYAAAYSGLADSWSMLSWYGFAPPRQAFPRAEAAARRALEMDDTLGAAHNSLSVVKHIYSWDFSGAERHSLRAIELHPNSAMAHNWYSWHLASMGRQEEALAAIHRARELDCLSLAINAMVGRRLYDAGRYDEAIAVLRQTTERTPNFLPGNLFLGMAYEQKGMFADAVRTLQTAMDDAGGAALFAATLAHVLAVAGRRDEARKLLAELGKRSRREYVPPYQIAVVHAGLGDGDEAFRWLERACVDRSAWLTQLNIDPRLGSLRSDDRFFDLLDHMHWPRRMASHEVSP